MATLEQILGFRNLTGVIHSVKSGIPNPLEGLGFMNPGRSVIGNRGEFYSIKSSRRVARIVQYGAPATRRELKDVTQVPVTLMHSFESQQWPMELMIALNKMNSLEHDEKAEEQANYQTVEFKRQFSNLRIAATLYTLFKGILYIDGGGNLLPSSTGARTTIDFKVPANNQGLLNGLISKGWSDSTATIVTMIKTIQTQARQLTGYKIDTAFYGDKVPEYIGANATAQQYLKLNPAMNAQFIETPSTVPPGFAGIKNWIYAGDAFFEDNTGTNRTIIGQSDVIFTPSYDPDWFEVLEGTYLVPTSIMPVVGGDAASALKNLVSVKGLFSYGQVSQNPVMVEQFAGDTFLPTLKVPSAVFQATVA